VSSLPSTGTAALSPESVLLAEAEGYHAVASAAHDRGDFSEAEYNFEKALELLASLEPDTEFTSDQKDQIDQLLEHIARDYQATVRERGDGMSPPEMSAFMMRFEDLESLRNWKNYSEMQRALEPDSVVYDVPVVWNERVRNCLFYFQTIARSNMQLYLERAGRYLPMMQAIFAEYGLPRDLCYLPIIESGFNTNAYSYARAMGPWQFISSTGHNYGLKRDWWKDERRDFERSTHAAARYLAALYEMFGDWYLALAAYNGGEGRVGRTIAKQKTKDFWQLRLRKQTENYVPLYLASVIIAKEPERFGFYVTPEPPLRWDEVDVGKPIELKVLARHLECTVEHLQQLNPELLRGVTPPQSAPYRLRVPEGKGARFASVYELIPQSERTEWVRHTIARGESLSSIARRYGVSVQAVKDANKLKSNRIVAGHDLVVPVPVGALPTAGAPSIQPSETGVYRVRAGESLWDIARAHGTTPEDLAGRNNISSRGKIYPGQMLKVPAVGSATRAAVPTAQAPDYSEHRVRAGESLWSIANEHGLSVSKLASINHISARGRIYPGQVLRVPASAGTPGAMRYVVRRGDTLTKIAQQFGVAVNELIEFNGISDPQQIHVGTTLNIPTPR
jgi:membrane-bound lytic murein transglycosylase D